MFSSLENVSVYAIYALVVNGMTSAVVTFTTGISSMWGNMLARGELDTLKKSYERVEIFTHIGVTWAFTTTAILIVPFVTVYTQNISDANYTVPIFALIFTAAYGLRCIRIPYLCITHAAGHYKQTQNGALIQMILNLAISLALVIPFGLIGVAAGTLVAMTYHTFYFAWYLRKNVLNRDFIHFLKHLAVDALAISLMYFAARNFSLDDISYYSWFVLAVKVSLISLPICLLVNFSFYRLKILSP